MTAQNRSTVLSQFYTHAILSKKKTPSACGQRRRRNFPIKVSELTTHYQSNL